MPDEPRRILEWNGTTISRQPPVIVHYCNPPSSGRAHLPCVYQSAACRGQATSCPECRFAYCEHHRPSHRRRVEFLPDEWERALRRAAARNDAAAAKRVGTE